MQPETPPDVRVLGLDLYGAPKPLVASARANGTMVFCYINAGAWEEWREDASRFEPETIGQPYLGWEREHWLDIRRIDLLAPIMRARLDLCAAKGFDAVEFDNLDGYKAETGFPLTEEDAKAYAIWLAAEARKRGLSPGLKNVPQLIDELEPHFDWLLMESCVRYGFCEAAAPFQRSNKLVLNAEYVENGMTLDKMCPAAARFGIHAILKRKKLDDWKRDCPA